MSLNANDAGSVTYDTMTAGSYPARTVSFVDLGMQARPNWGDEVKEPVKMVAMTYEFVDEFLTDEDGNDMLDKPRHLTEDMPLYSLSSERAKSTQRIKAFDPLGTAGGDLTKLLDVPVTVTVVTSPDKKGRVWENVAGVSPMREKDAKSCPPLVNTAKFFDFDKPDLDIFMSLPPFLQKRIKNSLEFEGSELDQMLGDDGSGGVDVPDTDETTDKDIDDGEKDENPY